MRRQHAVGRAFITAKSAVASLGTQHTVIQNAVDHGQILFLARRGVQLCRNHKGIHHRAGLGPLGSCEPVLIFVVDRHTVRRIQIENALCGSQIFFVTGRKIHTQNAARSRQRCMRLQLHAHGIQRQELVDQLVNHLAKCLLHGAIGVDAVGMGQTVQRNVRAARIGGQMPLPRSGKHVPRHISATQPQRGIGGILAVSFAQGQKQIHDHALDQKQRFVQPSVFIIRTKRAQKPAVTRKLLLVRLGMRQNSAKIPPLVHFFRQLRHRSVKGCGLSARCHGSHGLREHGSALPVTRPGVNGLAFKQQGRQVHVAFQARGLSCQSVCKRAAVAHLLCICKLQNRFFHGNSPYHNK